MGDNLDNIDKTEVMPLDYDGPTIEDLDPEMEEGDGEISRLQLNPGIMELIIEKLVETGRFKFKIFRDMGIPLTCPKLTSGIKKVKKIARGVIVCRRLKVVAHQASVRTQNRKKGEKVFNDFELPVYHERIKTISVDMVKLLNNQDKFYETYIHNESTAIHFADILDHMMHLCTSMLVPTNSKFTESLALPKRDPGLFLDIISQNKSFVSNIFDCYMIKINFALENKILFHSAYTCGKFMNTCLLYFDEIFKNKEQRKLTMNYIKSNLSLLCYYINKSHKMYRMK